MKLFERKINEINGTPVLTRFFNLFHIFQALSQFSLFIVYSQHFHIVEHAPLETENVEITNAPLMRNLRDFINKCSEKNTT